MLEKGEDLSEILTSEKKTHLANHQKGIRGGVDGRFERSAYYLKHIHYFFFFFVFNYPIMTFLLGPMKVEGGGASSLKLTLLLHLMLRACRIQCMYFQSNSTVKYILIYV